MGRPVLAAKPHSVAKYLTVERSAELEGTLEVLSLLVVNGGRGFDAHGEDADERVALELDALDRFRN